MNKIIVESYNPKWKKEFEKACKFYQKLLKNINVKIPLEFLPVLQVCPVQGKAHSLIKPFIPSSRISSIIAHTPRANTKALKTLRALIRSSILLKTRSVELPAQILPPIQKYLMRSETFLPELHQQKFVDINQAGLVLMYLEDVAKHAGGNGVKQIEMHFLADVFVTCEVCKGNDSTKKLSR